MDDAETTLSILNDILPVKWPLSEWILQGSSER